MKTSVSLVCLFFLCLTTLFSQNPGFSYQAIVRNASGELMKNIELDVNVELFNNTSHKTFFIENHAVKTNNWGQMSLEIGQGESVRGSLTDVPWKDGTIFYSIKIRDGMDFEIISEAEVLAVPLALHAFSADEISSDPGNIRSSAEFWRTDGNYIKPEESYLGTKTPSDLIIITDDKERIRVLSKGGVIVNALSEFNENVLVKEELHVLGESTFKSVLYAENDIITKGTVQIGQELEVHEGATVTGDFDALSNATIHKDLLVKGNACIDSNLVVKQKLLLKGDLEVEGSALIHEELDVNGKTTLNNELAVNGKTTLNDELAVALNSTFSSDVTVDGETNLNNNLSVTGNTTLSSDLVVEGETELNDKFTVNANSLLNGGLNVDGLLNAYHSLRVTEDLVVDRNASFKFYSRAIWGLFILY